MENYSEEDLQKLWFYEMDIYHELKRVCDKFGIKVCSSYGTALGAKRHQGFIPWDDDMDFAMTREDYEKFVQVAPKELNDKYELLEIRKTKGYVLTFAKLIRKDSVFIEKTDTDRTYHSGIFVDILPFDVVSNDVRRDLKKAGKLFYLARLIVLTEYPKPKLPKGMSPLARKVAHFGCGIISKALKITGNSRDKLYDKFIKTACSTIADSSDPCYTDYSLYRLEGAPKDKLVCFSKRIFDEIEELPFMGETICVPGCIDEYLKKTYGDYMKLPKEEDRHCHFPAVLEFPDV